MIKVLGLALYGPLAASTRYRLAQYVPGLAARGIDLQIRHLLGDDYLRRTFAGGKAPIGSLLHSGFGRLADLCGQHRYDALMLYSELFPLLPGLLERSLLRRPYLYDFDDAFYLKYRAGRLSRLSPLLGGKFERVMAGAAAISAGSHVLADAARSHNAATHLLPTVVDTGRYVPSMRAPSATFTIGWIGSPSTSHHLAQLVEPLSQLGREGPVHFVVIGGKAPAIPHIRVEELDWSEASEVTLINSFDVGVMPLHDDAWARGKCAFKLIQYMACGVPVVASPVGANVDVVQEDCGLLATTSDDWLTALRALRDQPDLRADMGGAARQRVEQHYSLQHNLPVLAELIRETAARGRP